MIHRKKAHKRPKRRFCDNQLVELFLASTLAVVPGIVPRIGSETGPNGQLTRLLWTKIGQLGERPERMCFGHVIVEERKSNKKCCLIHIKVDWGLFKCAIMKFNRPTPTGKLPGMG